jgi:hypothetical protein
MNLYSYLQLSRYSNRLWAVFGVRFLTEARKFPLCHLVQTGSRAPPPQPPIQRIPETLSLGVKWPGRKVDPSHPSSAEVKECVELYLHSPSTSSWGDAQLSIGTNLSLPFTYM